MMDDWDGGRRDGWCEGYRSLTRLAVSGRRWLFSEMVEVDACADWRRCLWQKQHAV